MFRSQPLLLLPICIRCHQHRQFQCSVTCLAARLAQQRMARPPNNPQTSIVMEILLHRRNMSHSPTTLTKFLLLALPPHCQRSLVMMPRRRRRRLIRGARSEPANTSITITTSSSPMASLPRCAREPVPVLCRRRHYRRRHRCRACCHQHHHHQRGHYRHCCRRRIRRWRAAGISTSAACSRAFSLASFRARRKEEAAAELSHGREAFPRRIANPIIITTTTMTPPLLKRASRPSNAKESLYFCRRNIFFFRSSFWHIDDDSK